MLSKFEGDFLKRNQIKDNEANKENNAVAPVAKRPKLTPKESKPRKPIDKAKARKVRSLLITDELSYESYYSNKHAMHAISDLDALTDFRFFRFSDITNRKIVGRGGVSID